MKPNHFSGKIVFLFIIIFLIFTFSQTFNVYGQEVGRKPPCDSYGDLNDDGTDCSADLYLLLKAIGGEEELSQEQKERADLNGDDVINYMDYQLLVDYKREVINTFPVCDTGECKDTDNGKNYGVKGECIVRGVKNEDTCATSSLIKEFYCEAGNCKMETPYHKCEYGCKNGACLTRNCEELLEKSNGLVFLYDSNDDGKIDSNELSSSSKTLEGAYSVIDYQISALKKFSEYECTYSSIDSCINNIDEVDTILNNYDKNEDNILNSEELAQVKKAWSSGEVSNEGFALALKSSTTDEAYKSFYGTIMKWPSPPCGNYGDINDNGLVEACGRDAYLLYFYLRSKSWSSLPKQITPQEATKRADVDGDGKLTCKDFGFLAVYAHRNYWKVINTFPVCKESNKCGNGICESGEEKCPDCTCGNGKCDSSLEITICPEDCGRSDDWCTGGEPGPRPQPQCGNGICEYGETPQNCPQDCKQPKPQCGNGICEQGETPQNCPQDCKPGKCTDTDNGKNYGVRGTCTGKRGIQLTDRCGEYPNSLLEFYCVSGYCRMQFYQCPNGCKNGACLKQPVCGNGICEQGETPQNCPRDCKKPQPQCGNGICERGETPQNCPQDCKGRKPPCDSYGDVDFDTSVTVSDAILTMMNVKNNNLNQSQKKRADVNGNGNTDFSDVGLIFAYARSVINNFPVCKKPSDVCEKFCKNKGYKGSLGGKCINITSCPSPFDPYAQGDGAPCKDVKVCCCVKTRTKNLKKGWNTLYVYSTQGLSLNDLESKCGNTIAIGVKEGMLYREKEELVYGKSYLVRVEKNCKVKFVSDIIPKKKLILERGWNLEGIGFNNLTVSELRENCEKTTLVIGLNENQKLYKEENKLESGKSYLIRVPESCSLSLELRK